MNQELKKISITLTTINLDSLRANEWDELATQTPHGIHLQLAWLQAYKRSYLNPVKQPGHRSLILEARDPVSRRLIGAIPLQMAQTRGTRFLPLRCVRPFANGPSDFFDLLAVPEQRPQLIEAFAVWLKQQSSQWDQLQLDLIPSSSENWRLLVDALQAIGYAPTVTTDRRFLKLDTTASWQDYYTGYLLKHFADFKTVHNRMKTDGVSPRVEILYSGIAPHLHRVLEHYRQRRDAKAQPDPFDDPSFGTFIDAVLPAYERLGCVAFSRLFAGDDVWAYSLDWLHRGVWYYYLPAFDERFKRYAPGKLLLYEVIKRAFENPNIQEFNFMRGESRYKRQFASESEAYMSISLCNPKSMRIKVIRLASWLCGQRDTLYRTVRKALLTRRSDVIAA
jgi:CelD/BcsL family acetyltransferase involved in cellulose biosynthesis